MNTFPVPCAALGLGPQGRWNTATHGPRWAERAQGRRGGGDPSRLPFLGEFQEQPVSFSNVMSSGCSPRVVLPPSRGTFGPRPRTQLTESKLVTAKGALKDHLCSELSNFSEQLREVLSAC